MSTILEADSTGALHIPPSMLPHAAPNRRYRVATMNGQLVVDEEKAEISSRMDHGAWLKELEERRARGATGKAGVPLQEILDDIR